MTSRVARRLRAAAASLGALTLALAAVVAAPPAAGAHELGPFQVYGSFQLDGSFRLEIKIDEEHLTPAQLGGPARTTRYGRIAGLSGPAERQFGRFLSDLADSLTLAFDGAEVRPNLAMDPDTGGGSGGAQPTRATLLVEGWIPGGTRAFTLRSSLPVKAFPLVLRCEGDESSIWKWVAGGEVSPAYPLPARVVPPAPTALARRGFEMGFAGVLPYGATALLLLAAMFLLARRIPAALLLLAVFAGGQALGLALALRAAAPPRPGLLEQVLALAVACLAAASLAAGRTPAAPAPPAPLVPPAVPESAAAPGSPASPASLAASATPAAPRSLRRWRLRAAVRLPAWLLAAILVIGALYGASNAPRFSAAASPSSASSSTSASSATSGSSATSPSSVTSASSATPATSAVSAGSATSPAGPGPPPPPPAALAGFDLGIFCAGLVTLAAAFALVGLPFRDKAWYQGRVVVPASCLIGLVGLYWSLSGLLP